MAALTVTQTQVGRLSVSATTSAGSAGTDTVSNAQLIAACERGPLYNFLNTTFATAAAAVAAFGTAGGMVSVSSDFPAPTVAWALDGGKPSLSLGANSAGAICSIRIALSYSASR